jgi:hypothetical protein
VPIAVLLLPGRVILLCSSMTLSNCRLTDGFENFLNRFVRHLPHTMTRPGSRRHICSMNDHSSRRNNQQTAVVTRMYVREYILWSRKFRISTRLQFGFLFVLPSLLVLRRLFIQLRQVKFDPMDILGSNVPIPSEIKAEQSRSGLLTGKSCWTKFSVIYNRAQRMRGNFSAEAVFRPPQSSTNQNSTYQQPLRLGHHSRNTTARHRSEILVSRRQSKSTCNISRNEGASCEQGICVYRSVCVQLVDSIS